MSRISLIWLGAAISIAEILTGASLESLGLVRGLIVIVLGHLIGFLLLVLAGVIGVKNREGSMRSSALSFGKYGSYFFAIMNIIQLIGWQGIMIFDASLSAQGILQLGHTWWCLIIGVLTTVWILLGLKHRDKLNVVVMALLLLLTIVLSYVIFSGLNNGEAGPKAVGEGLSFGQGLELSIAMPLSWLPMIADYTHRANKPIKTTFSACATYTLASIWMYVIGLGAAVITHETRIDQIMLKAGLGVAGLFIIVFSCVTTNFIDAFSCNQSTFALLPENRIPKESEGKRSLKNSIRANIPGIIDTIIGTAGAILFPMENITEFLYFIGSIFAPMISVQIADQFIVRHKKSDRRIDGIASISWILGFVIYRVLMNYDLVVGYTVPDMLITVLITVILRKCTLKAGALIKKPA
ncbi:putative hydroxymethylpyrimidine transporter CytX [Eubacterium xylanophilum]|uniref:putative hydroxymethylpyrimidine transporter CytX n=1 Tax=Eubacterium xylanophilum TaxID=39497 RepID=UPI00047D8635|nr:putative hydroxymethylpyrimidine transporter CytX [Eubacterium xylanophilum]